MSTPDVTAASDGQQAFEDCCWAHYLAQRAQRELPGDIDGEPTRDGLFWRREDGSYGVTAFNTAWKGWQWGVAFAARPA